MTKRPVTKQPAAKPPIKPGPPPSKGQTPALPPEKPATKPVANPEKAAFGVVVKPQLPMKPPIKPLPATELATPAKDAPGKPWVKSGTISVEMYAVGKGSRLCQSLMMALKHEGKSSYVSDDQYLKRFARYGWDDEEDKAAKEVLKLWNKGQKSHGFPTENVEGFFTQDEYEFEDPCTQDSETARIRCYRRQLMVYGINIMNNEDLNVEAMRGVVVEELEQFSSEQLAVILQGVQATGYRLSSYLSEILEREVTPDEIFRLVFGNIEFGYDSDRNNVGLTIATHDPTNPQNTIYILLDDGSFNENVAGGVPFGPLPASFVVVHELGHAFANRQGGNLDTDAYVAATGSFWNPGQVPLSVPMRPELAMQVGLVSDPAVSGNFLLPSGAYIPQGFDGGTFQQQRRNFPNEFSQFSPAEGFSDSFAQFILSSMILESLSINRYQYFETNLIDWLETIYESR